MEPIANLGSSLALAAHLRIQHGEGRLCFSQAPLHAQHLLLQGKSALRQGMALPYRTSQGIALLPVHTVVLKHGAALLYAPPKAYGSSARQLMTM